MANEIKKFGRVKPAKMPKKMPVPFKAPVANIKGIGKMGLDIGGLQPTVVRPQNLPASATSSILAVFGPGSPSNDKRKS